MQICSGNRSRHWDQLAREEPVSVTWTYGEGMKNGRSKGEGDAEGVVCRRSCMITVVGEPSNDRASAQLPELPGITG